MSSFVLVIDLLEITESQCSPRGSPAGNINEMYCLSTERETERDGDIDDMPFGLWEKAIDTKWDPINGLLLHITALISERSSQRSEQFYRPLSSDYSVAMKWSSLHRLRGAHDHHNCSPHRPYELKCSVYWKCSLQPQRTLAGHWLIKANLCSWCVF